MGIRGLLVLATAGLIALPADEVEQARWLGRPQPVGYEPRSFCTRNPHTCMATIELWQGVQTKSAFAIALASHLASDLRQATTRTDLTADAARLAAPRPTGAVRDFPARATYPN